MTLLLDWFDWTLRSSLGAVLVAIVVWLAAGCLGRKLPPRGHYWLWSLVVLRLMLPATPGASWSLLNLSPWPSAGESVGEGVASGPLPASAEEQRSIGPTVALPATISRTPAAPANGDLAEKRITNSPAVEFSWQSAALIWVAGAVGYFFFVFGQHLAFGRRVARTGLIADDRLRNLLAECQQRLGIKTDVRLLLLAPLSSPAVFGIRRPCLLLPKRLVGELSEQELAHVLLHELVHVRRRDLLLNWVWIFLQAWHWFNPVLWLALRRLRAERELVCDAEVLSHLRATEHPSYGATLLRLITIEPPPAPGLALVFTRHHNLERRIRMIAQFTPKSRLALAGSALLALLLAGLTFTRAADPAAAPPAVTPIPDPKAAVPAETARGSEQKKLAREQRERGLRVLEAEMKKLEAITREQKSRLDEMKVRFGIADGEDVGVKAAPSSSPAEPLRSLEGMRIEAEAEHARMTALYTRLTNSPQAELRRIMATAVPDALLTRLLEQHAMAEQSLAQAEITFAGNPQHLDLKRQLRQVDVVNRQINERLDGMLQGLKVTLDSKTAQLATLHRAVELTKKSEIEAAITRRPYRDLQRELENQLYLLERLKARFLQERLDAEMERQ